MVECNIKVEIGCQHCKKCSVAAYEKSMFDAEKRYEEYLQYQAEKQYQELKEMGLI